MQPGFATQGQKTYIAIQKRVTATTHIESQEQQATRPQWFIVPLKQLLVNGLRHLPKTAAEEGDSQRKCHKNSLSVPSKPAFPSDMALVSQNAALERLGLFDFCLQGGYSGVSVLENGPVKLSSACRAVDKSTPQAHRTWLPMRPLAFPA